MGLRWAILVVVAAALLAGCGDGDRPSWDGPPSALPADGTLPVDGFIRYLDAVDEPWKHSPVGIATAYALPLARETQDVHAEYVTSDPDGNAIVSVTIGLLDDSVRELRLVLRLDPIGDSSFRLLDAIWLQRCHEGRGHQGWSRERCV